MVLVLPFRRVAWKDLVEAAPDPPSLESLPIRSFDREAGQIVLLDPPGKSRDAEPL